MFTIHKLLSFNNRDEVSRTYTRSAQDMGYYSSGVWHTRTDEVLALMGDPQLRVKMLSLEARERNRMRGIDQRRSTATWPYDVSSQRDMAAEDLSDREVEQRLMERYR